MTERHPRPGSRPSPKLWRMRVTELACSRALSRSSSAIAAVGGRGVALVVVVGVRRLAARSPSRSSSRAAACARGGTCEREDDLLVRRGVLVSRLSVVPYGRMQLVEVTAGMMERMFGLSTVKLHTAAARSDARIPGLEPAEAARLRDRLAALGEAKAAGL